MVFPSSTQHCGPARCHEVDTMDGTGRPEFPSSWVIGLPKGAIHDSGNSSNLTNQTLVESTVHLPSDVQACGARVVMLHTYSKTSFERNYVDLIVCASHHLFLHRKSRSCRVTGVLSASHLLINHRRYLDHENLHNAHDAEPYLWLSASR